MRLPWDTLARYQPLTKLGVTLVFSGLVLAVYGWIWFNESRALVARGKHGIAEIKEIRRMSREPGKYARFRMHLEMHTDKGWERITHYFRGRWKVPWSEGERISIVYLPKTPSVFQFGKTPYLNVYGLGGGLLMLFVGIVLPIVEKRRDDAGLQRSRSQTLSDEPLTETEERHVFGDLDLQDYHGWVNDLMSGGFGVMGNAAPVDIAVKGGRARLERQFHNQESVAVLYIIQPSFLSQLTGGSQRMAAEFISLLGDGTFIITTNHDSGHQDLAQRDSVLLMQMPDSMDAPMLKEAHEVRLRENVAQRSTSVVPIAGRDEADKLLAGLSDLG